MSPAIETFHQACLKNIAWCVTGTLPSLRQVVGQQAPEVSTSLSLINDCLVHIAQMMHNLDGECQLLVLESRALH